MKAGLCSLVLLGVFAIQGVGRADEGNLYLAAVNDPYYPNNLELEYEPDEGGQTYNRINDDNYLSINYNVNVGTANLVMQGITQTHPDLQGLCGYTTLLQSSFTNITGVSYSSYYQSVNVSFELLSDFVEGNPVHPDGTDVTLYFTGIHSHSVTGAASIYTALSEMEIRINGSLRGTYVDGVLTNYDNPNTANFNIEVGQTVTITGQEWITVNTASYSTGGAASSLATTMTLLVADIE